MALKLPLVRWGKGPTRAVLLHGFTGDGHAFDHLEPLLGERLTVVAPTLPGHGAAPHAQNFSEVLDALKPLLDGPTLVAGYSQGARLALALALAQPRSIERLVLESGTAGLQRHADRVERRAEDEARAQRLLRAGVETFISEWEALPLFAGVKGRSEVAARRRSHTAEGLASALRAYGLGAQPDFWPKLATLRVPTLLLSGQNDLKFTLLARRLCDALPMAWRKTFDGAGHAPHLEAPAAYAQELANFTAVPLQPERFEVPEEAIA